MNSNKFRDPIKKSWWRRFKEWINPSYKPQNLIGVEVMYIKEPTPEQYKEYYDRVKSGESMHKLKQEHLQKYSTTIALSPRIVDEENES